MNKLIARSQADIDAIFEVREDFPDPGLWARTKPGQIYEVVFPVEPERVEGRLTTDLFSFSESKYRIECYKPVLFSVYRYKNGEEVRFWFWTKISG